MNRYFLRIKTHIVSIIPYIISRLIFVFVHIDKNKFFFVSMRGGNYGDNMKSISDYVQSHHDNAIIVWGFNNDMYDKMECNHIKVKFNTFRYYYHQFTSKYFITNDGTNKYTFTKRNGHIKVQTWHGTALKRLGKDVINQDHPKWLLPFKPKAMKSELKEADIFISGSKFMTDVFHHAYEYPRKIFETGTPRNDIFFSNRPDVILKVKKWLKIEEPNRIILYAPTFRADNKLTYYDIDLNKIRKLFEDRWHTKYTILVRLHPSMIRQEKEFEERHLDTVGATFYPDMQELLYASDVLITDYSSTMFDIMYSYKPVILYVPDRKTYNRGFYFDIDKLPFMVVNNNSEIDNVVSKFDENEYRKKIENFKLKIGSVEDGRAAEHVYNLMMNFPD